MKNKVIIGIDPDNHKSGFAVVYDGKVQELEIYSLWTLWDRINYVIQKVEEQGLSYIVVVEKGEDNKYLYKAREAAKHANVRNKDSVMCNSAMKSGKNFSVTDQIIGYCKDKGIKYKTYAPNVSKEDGFKIVKRTFKNIPERIGSEKKDALRCCLFA